MRDFFILYPASFFAGFIRTFKKDKKNACATVFIKSERECCDFFNFKLVVAMLLIRLEISGDKGANDWKNTVPTKPAQHRGLVKKPAITQATAGEVWKRK